MPVPDFQSLMLPALKALAGGREAPLFDVREHIAAAERLTADDLQEMLPSDRQSVFVNRVSWAVIYLGRAGLTERVRRGVWRLTAEGERLLADPPSRIDMDYLRKYPAYVAWRTGKNEPSSTGGCRTLDIGRLRGHAGRSLGESCPATTRGTGGRDMNRVREAPPSFLEFVSMPPRLCVTNTIGRVPIPSPANRSNTLPARSNMSISFFAISSNRLAG